MPIRRTDTWHAIKKRLDELNTTVTTLGAKTTTDTQHAKDIDDVLRRYNDEIRVMSGPGGPP
jgi:hypothetical protein